MASAVFPAPSGGASPIRSIQRGYAASSGAITITSVDTGKSFVRGYSAAASGSAGGPGTYSGTLSPSGGQSGSANSVADHSWNNAGSFPSYSGTTTFSAGGTNLVSKEFNVYFTNSTTITATGSCYWEVVEYN